MAGERGRGRVTLRDVALAANVSTTTVSDSLNGSGSLPEKTRQRVRKIALELGYRPSVAARSLRNGRTGILVIAMLPSDVDAESLWHVDYFMRVMAGAAIEANQRGFFLAVAPAAMQLDVAHDGLIAVDPAEGDPLVESARQRGTPASTVGRTASDAASWVDNDWAGVVGDVLDHLERGGARRPMLIAPDSAASYIGSVEREFGSRCRRHGYAPRSARIAGAFNPAAARAAVRDILDGPDRPDALFVGLDQLALAAELAATDLGLRVPEDLMLVNLGDGAAVALAPVPISVVELHAEEMGRAAVRMLVDQIEQNAEPRHEVVPAHLVVRASSRG
ncbi:LacI family DNA-binding transcriptional regulator [Mycolicibacterium smegmatis]|uniref:LacI family DNA-binding transcriptional regulator n=1 Tax=Mycolicibacterium smegmatis TaxID=1772 RepID=UPI001E284CC9|nr:LacI family DNA-binding transcriptional regulator [Mycolicibacterium smegmatis]UGU29259.1 LacI family transcriptional regulator [Mycolicibacterium smegmatis]ULN35340.1 LacI family transcriptional regulator [Mycolicibacterium smegmatis]ULN70230.1 LacI family transcriptional regulator [Mycolicibacterium smegmatis]